jgi:hypothetical protein
MKESDQLYRLLTGYKSGRNSVSSLRQFRLVLGAVIWRWVDAHERCMAREIGLDGDAFDVVTTVPSGSIERDEGHPLRGIVGGLVTPLSPRFERVLRRSAKEVPKREVDPEKYTVPESQDIRGKSILLVEDAWVTGSNAESAAGALKAAGAAKVAVLVVGRVLDPRSVDTESRFEALSAIFDWDWCPYHRMV